MSNPTIFDLLKRMEDKIDLAVANSILLTEKVDKLQKDVDYLTTDVHLVQSEIPKIATELATSINKITDQVEFVNGIYDNIKAPFHQAMDFISWSQPQHDKPQHTPREDVLEDESYENIFSMILFGISVVD